MGRKRKNPIQVKLLSVNEISELYDFHPNTVRSWIHRDDLRHYRRGRGGRILIREDDLIRFFDRYYEP